MQRYSVKKLVNLAVFLALGVVFNIMENYIFLVPLLPGVKLGLANTIGLILLALYGPKEFILIGFLRVILSGTFSGFGSSFIISLSGFTLSSIVVLLAYHLGDFSLFGLSLLSAVTHGIGQVAMIAVLYEDVLMLNYAYIMIASGIVTGVIIASLSRIVILRLQSFKIESSNYEIN